MKATLKIKFVFLLLLNVLTSIAADAQDAATISAQQSHAPVSEQPLSNATQDGLDNNGVMDVSVTEYESMTKERQQFVKDHPDQFRLLDAGNVDAATPQNDLELGLEPSQVSPERHKLSKDELKAVSPEKLSYMRAHPELYDLSELKE